MIVSDNHKINLIIILILLLTTTATAATTTAPPTAATTATTLSYNITPCGICYLDSSQIHQRLSLLGLRTDSYPWGSCFHPACHNTLHHRNTQVFEIYQCVLAIQQEFLSCLRYEPIHHHHHHHHHENIQTKHI